MADPAVLDVCQRLGGGSSPPVPNSRSQTDAMVTPGVARRSHSRVGSDSPATRFAKPGDCLGYYLFTLDTAPALSLAQGGGDVLGEPPLNGGAGSYSICSWIFRAASSPAMSATTRSAMSIPELTVDGHSLLRDNSAKFRK